MLNTTTMREDVRRAYAMGWDAGMAGDRVRSMEERDLYDYDGDSHAAYLEGYRRGSQERRGA